MVKELPSDMEDVLGVTNSMVSGVSVMVMVCEAFEPGTALPDTLVMVMMMVSFGS